MTIHGIRALLHLWRVKANLFGWEPASAGWRGATKKCKAGFEPIANDVHYGDDAVGLLWSGLVWSCPDLAGSLVGLVLAYVRTYVRTYVLWSSLAWSGLA